MPRKKKEPVKKKAKKKAAKKTAPTVEQEMKGPCAMVHEIAAAMPKDATPQEVYDACEASGIHPATTRKQYGLWFRKQYGITPAQKFGHKGGRGGKRPPSTTIDDSKAPVITGAKYSEGWTSRMERIGSESVDVITSPDGVDYVLAKSNERADLIIDHTAADPAIGRVRWRALEDSGRGRKMRKEKKEKTARAKAKKKTTKKKVAKK